MSLSTGLWYCPVCGYVSPDDRATDTHCPKNHAKGLRRPAFREIHRGCYVRIGTQEGCCQHESTEQGDSRQIVEVSKAQIIEMIAGDAHKGWMEGKRAQGVDTRQSEWGEELMVPYSDLTEQAKDLDRSAVRHVVDALDSLGLLVRSKRS
jgi:hypothetical protein